MAQKRIPALFLACLLILPVFMAGAEVFVLPGYTREGGQVYAAFGAYPMEKDGAPGALLWRVLRNEHGQALLLSDKILDVRPVHAGSAYLGFEESTLKRWLTEEFFLAAFSGEERTVIARAGELPDISLPTAAMLRDELLGFRSGADRAAIASPWAISKGCLSYGGAKGSYWTADASQNMRNGQRRVLNGGDLGNTRADAENMGVRPLIRLDLGHLRAITGSGSREDPFLLIPDGRLLPPPTPSPVPTPMPTPLPMGMISIDHFPVLSAEGFLPEGAPEYVFIDAENGVWRYASTDLRIEITRHQETDTPLRWLGAEIFVREGARPFRMVSHDRDHMLEDRTRYLEKPAVIMRNNNLVFSMDGDYFIYRLGRAKNDNRNLAIGVEIRGGEILVDKPPSSSRNAYPPLDMLALFQDGDMRVFKAGEKTARELVDLGAWDVLSFGPYLIREGEVNTSYINYGTTLQPRAAIGMVTKGHYWAVIVEGRIRPSRGMTCLEVADLMKTLGCETAFNLDGGWTSAMVFMGKQLNQLDKLGVHDNARTQNEVMGIGYTDAYLEGRAP